MTDKIDQLPEHIQLALDYSRNFATAKPNIGLTEKEHILGLANLLEKTAFQLQGDRAQQLWAVHAQGPDELWAAESHEAAEQHAAALNALPGQTDAIKINAVVIRSPWSEVDHWKTLAEQWRQEAEDRMVSLRALCARVEKLEAAHPDTASAPRKLLAEAESIIESHAEALMASHAPGGDWEGEEAAHDDYEREAGVASKLRAILAGGAE